MIERVLFLGSKTLGLRCLSQIHQSNAGVLVGVITIDDREDVRTCFNGFQSFCEDNRVDLFVASDRRHSEELIAKLQPDICLLAGWYWIVGEKTLRSVPKGCLGIHFSLLPKYRGWSPLVWAMLRGESETGLSLFTMTKDVDAGTLWEQIRVPIHFVDDVGSVLKRLEDAAVDVMKQKFRGILEGSVVPWQQPLGELSYCARRLPDDGLIDWSQSSLQLYDFVRAQSMPYPGAFTFLGDAKVTIWKARPTNTPFFGAVGQVVQTKADGICAVCGDQRPLVLELVQIEDDPTPSSPEQAFRGHNDLTSISSGRLRFHSNRRLLTGGP